MPLTIALFSYSVAAIAFLLLFGLLLIKWRGKKHGSLLTLACFMTALWAASVVYFARLGAPLNLPTGILEILRNAGWSAFLLALLGPADGQRFLFGLRVSRQAAVYAGAYVLLFVVTIACYLSIDLAQSPLGFIGGSFGHVALAIMGMLLIEQLFRNASSKERWALKFACLGIGGLFAYDFYLYVDALLFKQVNAEIWAARGIVNAFVVPLIAVSAARNPQWSVGISVSRRVIFHSATLIGSASYLLVMAAAGYYLRFFGGEWGTVLQVAFLFGAAMLLMTVLFSGAVRSWLKVSISKHFYNYGYDYREEWLRFTRMLSAEGPQLGERAIQAIAELVESPKGLLYTKNESDLYVVAARWNTDFTNGQEAAGSPFCEFLKNKQWVIDLHEWEANPEKYESLPVPGWLRDFDKAWLVVPLILNANLVGFVVLSQSRSKIALNWEVLDLLKIVGVQTASYLANQESANALAVARQFETFNRMSTFVVHDLKNLVSQLALLVANAEKHKDSPEFQKDMLETIEHAVLKMRMLLQKFNRESSVEQRSAVLVDKILQQAVASKTFAEPKPQLEIRKSGMIVSADAARLERVVGHMIQNAIEATSRDGRVIVRATKLGGKAVIEIADTGRGMSDQFIRERLFKPFESTKSAGMGIGVFETREYVHHIGGELEVDSRPSVGTTFRIRLPLHEDDQDRVLSAA